MRQARAGINSLEHDRMCSIAGRRGGGCEIRTREGLPPTRFPSVRPRPLGESSVGKPTDMRHRACTRFRPGFSTDLRPVPETRHQAVP